WPAVGARDRRGDRKMVSGFGLQLPHRFVEVARAGVGRLAVRDGSHQPVLPAVGEAFEVLLYFGVLRQRPGELRRDLYVALFRVELDVDVDGVACGDMRALADVVADAEHVGSTHRRDRTAVRVAVDRDLDERALGGAEAVHDLGGDFDSGGGLAGEQDLGSKSHSRFSRASCRAGMIEIQVQPTTSASQSGIRLPWLSPLMT